MLTNKGYLAMRFIFILAIFIVCAGFYLDSGAYSPWLKWVGRLPGDLIIHKGDVLIYLPLASALLVSIVFSLLFRRRQK